MNVEETLAERGSRYGSFAEQAKIAYGLKDVMRDSRNWNQLPPYQKEALDMIANKVGRMLNGDFKYLDTVVDIEGYTALIRRELENESN